MTALDGTAALERLNNTQPSLQRLRQRIDALDEQLVTLISERARCAQQVADVKLAEDPNAIFYRPEREAQVLQRIKSLNLGPLADDDMAKLFREIMSFCLALEKPLCVAYLGPQGTFTQQAMLKQFGSAVKGCPVASIEEVFQHVEAGHTTYGIVPVENSTEGTVNETLDLLMNSALGVCGEIVLPIHHYLLGHASETIQPARIYSHPQSLAQCRGWLEHNMPNAELIAVSSNAEAVRRAEQEVGSAAIAGEQAAQYFDMQILHECIEDFSHNVTRFLVIGQQDIAPSGDDRTALMATLTDQPGALSTLLGPLGRHGIDVVRLLPRPDKQQPWKYVFFLDIRGHAEDAAVKQALSEIQSHILQLKILGSYPVCAL